jgi:soluble lytic murein transglycosylase-like protein
MGMITHLDIGSLGQNAKASSLPKPGNPQSAAGSFQKYLDMEQHNALPNAGEKLTPEAIRALALNLITALDRASMNTLFSDTGSKRDASFAERLSTDLFMAMRNHSAMPAIPVQQTFVPHASQELPASSVEPGSDSEPLRIEPEKQLEVFTSSGTREQKYAPLIFAAAEKHGLDPKLIEAVVRTESDFNPQAVSSVGAQGLMQLMPGTAADLGVSDAFNPEQNIEGGSRYLKQLLERYDGNTKLALAAYNWGMGNLERNPELMPQETVNYVAKITGLMNKTA